LISDRSQIDSGGSDVLRRDSLEIRGLMDELLAHAQRGGLLCPVDVMLGPVAARALVHGLAGTHGDGHFVPWGVAPDGAERQPEAALGLVIGSLTPPQTIASVSGAPEFSRRVPA
jgi:hypothetical protein